jgi:hypothetical protein
MVDPILGQLLGHGMKGEPLCPNCRRNVSHKFGLQCAASLASWHQMRSSGIGQLIGRIIPKELMKNMAPCEESAYGAIEAAAQVRYLLGKEFGLLAGLHPDCRLDLLRDVTKWFHDKKGCGTLERLASLQDRRKAKAFKAAIGEDAMNMLLFWEQFVHGLVLRELQRLTADLPEDQHFERDMLLEKLRDKVAAIQREFKEDPIRFNDPEEKLTAFRYDPAKQAEIDEMWERRREENPDDGGIDLSALFGNGDQNDGPEDDRDDE